MTSTASPRAPSTLQLVLFSSLCSVLAPLNSTMIAVALPSIRDDFALGRGTVSWLVSAYLIAMAVAQPVAGRLGDQLGRGRVVRAGLLAFTVTSVAAVAAPNFEVLIVLRVAQATFGAGLIPNAMALLRERAGAGELGRLNGYNGAAIAAAAGLGPLLGAAALGLASWRIIFLATVPVALGALALMPGLRLSSSGSSGNARPDWYGTLHYAVLLTVLTALLAQLRSVTGSLAHLAGWIVFAVLLGAFVWRQRRARTPVAAWRLFRHASFAAASIQILLTNLAMYTTLLMVPFLVSDVLDEPAGVSGLLLGLMALFMGLAAPVGGRVSDRHGRRPAAQLGGAIVVAASTLLVAVLHLGVTTPQLAGLLMVLGAGVGIGTGAATTAAVESAPRAMAGEAAGTSSMMRYVGSIVGAGVLAATLNTRSGAHPNASTFVSLQIVVATMAAGALLAASFLHRMPEEELEGIVLAATAAGDD
ncbi:MAG: MFS transporter [Dehalococcoidia bacterium]|nr:MFS transporter [Dehalococcoidia bacterium]